MKLLIAILAIVFITSIWESTATPFYLAKNIERYWTICLPNDVLSTKNQSENAQLLTIAKTIDTENNLLVSAIITRKDKSGIPETMHKAKSLSICTDGPIYTWNYFVVNFFNSAVLESHFRDECFLESGVYQMDRKVMKIYFGLNDPVASSKQYHIEYNVETTNHQPVFSPLKFNFELDGPLRPPRTTYW